MPGVVTGIITDSATNGCIVNATVEISEGGILKGGAVTDYNGRYTIEPIDPGYYSLKVIYIGYKYNITTDVPVVSGQTTIVKVEMETDTGKSKGVTINAYDGPHKKQTGKIEKTSLREGEQGSSPGVYMVKKNQAEAIMWGTIAGTVTNSKTNEPIVNAMVKVLEGNMVKGGTVSDSSGTFIIKTIDTGQYTVTVTHSGFKAYTITNLLVQTGKVVRINAQMPIDTSVHSSGTLYVIKGVDTKNMSFFQRVWFDIKCLPWKVSHIIHR
jgi:protocatechuate 3,4-dioxygenase beta subunit